MGFIGRNGAGKTTTIKSMLNIVHRDAGDISFFGLDILAHEDEIKNRTGYAGGAADYYKRRKISDIVDVTKRFYKSWDDAEYRRYMDAFSLDESKKPMELSEGMKVKLSLVMALSHHAELLILDEPTSGLDPVSREELLEDFKFLRDRGVSVFFSTHITSDLEKCADYITYISSGRLIASKPLDEFIKDGAAAGMGSTIDDIMVSCEKESLYDKLAL